MLPLLRMLKVRELSKNFGLFTVLDGVSFDMNIGDKIALVGENGTGKSTLLKTLSGIVEYDFGTIEYKKDLTFAYLPQTTIEINHISVHDYFCSKFELSSRQKELSLFLDGFGLSNIDLNRTFGELSGGQKTKCLLVAMLLSDAELLFLDEPTNNLDIPSLVWLETFLKETNKTFIVISHDRKFLDAVANKVFELDKSSKKLIIRNGKYSDYLISKQKAYEKELFNYALQQEEIGNIQEQILDKKKAGEAGAKFVPPDNDKFAQGYQRNKAGKSSRKAGILQRKLDKIEILDRPKTKKSLRIDFDHETHGPDFKLKLEDAFYKNYSFALGPISIDIVEGSRVAILGANGSGKTTFLKMLTSHISLISGAQKISTGVRIGNLMQEHENLKTEVSPLQFLLDRVSIEHALVYNQLVRYGFNEYQIKASVEHLSSGMKTRLLIALFALTEVNTLVLDEPTNHLDFEAMEALVDVLKDYKGTVILVSHDRFLLEACRLDVCYVLENNLLQKIDDYSTYVQNSERHAELVIRRLENVL